MDRISQWVSSHSIPADLTIRVGDSVFPLHKAVMVHRCGYIRRALADGKDPLVAAEAELDLSALPGGADAFEAAARCCYGASPDVTARNAAFLDMRPPADLARRAEEFLARSGLATLPAAAAVLRSCEALLPAAEDLGVARRAADAVARGICAEGPGRWAAELAALAPASFRRVATALCRLRADPEAVAGPSASWRSLGGPALSVPRERMRIRTA